MELNLPHTTPLVFSFERDQDKLAFKGMEYIGNHEEIGVKMNTIKNESKPPVVWETQFKKMFQILFPCTKDA